MILRKSKEPKTVVVTGPVDPNASLKHMKFKGEVEQRPMAVYEDPAPLQAQMISLGYYLDALTARALWIKLSVDYYPFGAKPEKAWLENSRIRKLAEDHALKYLRPAE